MCYKKCSLFSTRATDQFWKSHSNLKVKPTWICFKRPKDESQYETFWLLSLDMIGTHADQKNCSYVVDSVKQKKQKLVSLKEKEPDGTQLLKNNNNN